MAVVTASSSSGPVTPFHDPVHVAYKAELASDVANSMLNSDVHATDDDDSPCESQDAGGRLNTSDACVPIVQTLMYHRKGGESEGFSKRAIESLVKKLKEKRDELESLIEAVTTNGSRVGRCVTIARTLDGRLQVAGKKGFPHVIYCRIWRYSDLHKNELQHIKECKYAFDLKHDLVCVNPFHYNRVVPPGLTFGFDPYGGEQALSAAMHGIDLPTFSGYGSMPHHPSLNIPGGPSNFMPYGEPPGQPGGLLPLNHHAAMGKLLPGGSKMEPLEMLPNVSQTLGHSGMPLSQHPNDNSIPPELMFSRPPNPSTISYHSGPGGAAAPQPPLLPPNMRLPHSDPLAPPQMRGPLFAPPPGHPIDASGFGSPHGIPHQQQLPAPHPWSPYASSEHQQHQLYAHGDESSHSLSSPVMPRSSIAHHLPPPQGSVTSSQRFSAARANTDQSDIPPTVAASYHAQALEQNHLQISMPGGTGGVGAGTVSLGNIDYTDEDREYLQLLRSQPPPESWCSLTYYELDQKVAEMFKVPNHYDDVAVDGYVDPTGHTGGNRICLGALSNIHRTEQSEKTRMHIGRGVILKRQETSDVWLNNLSDHAVFVQSYYLDREAGREPGQAVHKIYPGASIKVFDLRQCFAQLMQHARMSQERQSNNAGGGSSSTSLTANNNNTAAKLLKSIHHQQNVGVDDFVRFCVVRMSFVKGWGPDYEKRSEIKDTPCWIEVQIQRAMQLLDEVLRLVPGLSNARGQEYV